MKRRSTVASGSGVATLLVVFTLGLAVSAWAPGHPVNHVVSVSDSFPVTDSVSAKLGQGYSASAAAYDEC